MKKYVIFDLWYTLIYLDEGWKTFNILKEEFNIPKNQWVKEVKQLFLCNEYCDEKSFLIDFVKITGTDLDIKKYANILRDQKKYDLSHIKTYQDVMPALKQIKLSGYNLGILSNQCTFYEPWFNNNIISQQFDVVIFSNNVGVRKPNPDIYKIFLDKACVHPKDCIMIGDNIGQDVNTPKSLEMSAIHLDRKNNSRNSIKTLDEAVYRIANKSY